MHQREATYPMKSFSNGWVQLGGLHQSCWQTLRSWSFSSRLWRRTYMLWRTSGQLTTLSTTLCFWTKSSWFTLNLLTSPAGATNRRARSCLAQSPVLMERMTFLTIYRVSALPTIYSHFYFVKESIWTVVAIMIYLASTLAEMFWHITTKWFKMQMKRQKLRSWNGTWLTTVKPSNLAL